MTQAGRSGSVGKGMLIGFALQVLILLRLPALLIIAIAQLVYIIPAVIVFRRQRATVNGILIAAAIVALLNVACWTLLASGSLRIGGY